MGPETGLPGAQLWGTPGGCHEKTHVKDLEQTYWTAHIMHLQECSHRQQVGNYLKQLWPADPPERLPRRAATIFRYGKDFCRPLELCLRQRERLWELFSQFRFVFGPVTIKMASLIATHP